MNLKKIKDAKADGREAIIKQLVALSKTELLSEDSHGQAYAGPMVKLKEEAEDRADDGDKVTDWGSYSIRSRKFTKGEKGVRDFIKQNYGNTFKDLVNAVEYYGFNVNVSKVKDSEDDDEGFDYNEGRWDEEYDEDLSEGKPASVEVAKEMVDSQGIVDIDEMGYLWVKKGQWTAENDPYNAEQIADEGYTFFSVDGPEYAVAYPTWEELVEAEDIQGILAEDIIGEEADI